VFRPFPNSDSPSPWDLFPDSTAPTMPTGTAPGWGWKPCTQATATRRRDSSCRWASNTTGRITRPTPPGTCAPISGGPTASSTGRRQRRGAQGRFCLFVRCPLEFAGGGRISGLGNRSGRRPSFLFRRHDRQNPAERGRMGVLCRLGGDPLPVLGPGREMHAGCHFSASAI